jgi:hypothetical protein
VWLSIRFGRKYTLGPGVAYSPAAAERRIPKKLSPLDNPGKEFIYRDWVISYAYVRLRSGRAEGELQSLQPWL